MKQTIEEIIKKNLPEKRTQDNLPFENSPEIYGNQRIKAYKNGFNQALSQINTSLIADEVLKVVVEKCIEKTKLHHMASGAYNSNSWDAGFHDALFNVENGLVELLSNLSPNKENKK